MSGILVYLPSDSPHGPVRRDLASGESLSFGRGAPGLSVGLRLDNPTIRAWRAKFSPSRTTGG